MNLSVPRRHRLEAGLNRAWTAMCPLEGRFKPVPSQNKVSGAKAPQGLDHLQWGMGHAPERPRPSLHVHLVEMSVLI